MLYVKTNACKNEGHACAYVCTGRSLCVFVCAELAIHTIRVRRSMLSSATGDVTRSICVFILSYSVRNRNNREQQRQSVIPSLLQVKYYDLLIL